MHEMSKWGLCFQKYVNAFDIIRWFDQNITRGVFELVKGSVSSNWCVNFCQSWLILRYFQIVCQEFSEYLQNSLFKEHLWLNFFDFYVLVPERFLLSVYINILEFSFHWLSIGFIASAIDCPSAYRLGGWH